MSVSPIHNTRARLLAPLAALALFAPAFRASAAPKPEPKLPPPARYQMYFHDQLAGSEKVSFARETFEGKHLLVEELESKMKVNAAGEVERTTKTRRYFTPENHLVFVSVEVTAGHEARSMRARVLADHLECEIDINGQKSTKSVSIPAGATIEGSEDFRHRLGMPKPGGKESAFQFDTNNLVVAQAKAQVVARDSVRVGERTIKALVLQAGDVEKDWFTEDGILLRGEVNSLGFKMLRDDLEQPQVISSTPTDLMDATAVPTDRMIDDPRHVYSLTLKVSGIPSRGLVLSDARQRATVDDAKGTLAVTYEVEAAFPPQHGARAATSAGDDPMLQDDPYLGINDPAIRKQAQAIAAGETDRAVIARRIHDWVFARMTYVNAGDHRSAREIMEHQDGVCREYATLFAALARAAGIPTRVCGGFLYKNGSLYYHAWNECRLTEGSGGWYPFDATAKGDFVDATHVKLSQGDVDDMFRFASAVGRVKAEVVSFR